MNRIESTLNTCLQSRMAKHGLVWSDFSKGATEIVVFGSRAVGVNRRKSDLDVLIVGKSARRMKRRDLDVISISSLDLTLPNWLNSELAGHISKYGIWLKGAGDWRSQVSVGSEAKNKKERRLVSLVHSLKHSWAQLHPAFQFKYCLTIRRELQRLALLRAAVPIPPTPMLDWEWQAGRPRRDVLLHVSNSILRNAEGFILNILLERSSYPNQLGPKVTVAQI
jgi:predicted nucleotidyltransferase